MDADLERILITRETIAHRVRELAEDIAVTYRDRSRELVIVPILSGSLIFLADLIRCLPFKMRIGLMTTSSYPGATAESQGAKLIQPLSVDVRGQDVLVVDDILDTGSTLRLVGEHLRAHEPASVRNCVLLRKPSKAPADLRVDFLGFDIEDVFVVGFGLDYNNLYRNWPDIWVLRQDVYA